MVTGGARGIGGEISLKISELGATVVVNYSSSAQFAENLCADIEKNGGFM
ncbi:SDR family NAD(P)-dependent oxidoreductase [Maridesulfovibrio frigidus]